jgi:uncharacterized protein (TIGR03790 family)
MAMTFISWILACAGPDRSADDFTGASKDFGSGTGSGDNPPVAWTCAVVNGVSLTAADVSLPTSGIGASVIDAGSGVPYTVQWSATGGTLDGIRRRAVTWTLDDTVAIDGRESFTITAVVTARGCSPQTYRAELTADWPESQRTVVLFNPDVAGSEDVADYYAAFRGIPPAAICGVTSSDPKTIPTSEFATWIDAAQRCIDGVGERTVYVVPVYGVPFEVSGLVMDFGIFNTHVTTSLDAQLVFGATSLDMLAANGDYPNYNPLYQYGDSSDGVYQDYVPFSELWSSVPRPYYLVARIDGSSPDAAMDLVDRTELAQGLADAGALDGIVYVDGRMGDTPPTTEGLSTYEAGEWNMWGTRRIFEALHWYDVVWDGNDAEFGTAPAPTYCPDALYFAGWYGSAYHYNGCFEWAPGAIGGHLESYSADDLRGGPSWVHNALEAGITATFGSVEEPYVMGMPEYDQFFLYLTQGASYGEAAYESTLLSQWMVVWVGDPLYRPYRR